MVNTYAPLFTDNTHALEMETQQAELYARIFPMAAEDFTTNTDVLTYIKNLTIAIQSLQTQVNSLMEILANHTHVVEPHSHTIEPHVHAIQGNVTYPNVNALITGPMPLLSNIPVQYGAIRWNYVQMPEYMNTTNAVPNLGGATVTPGPSMAGPLVVTARRTKPPEALLKPAIPPILGNLL